MSPSYLEVSGFDTPDPAIKMRGEGSLNPN